MKTAMILAAGRGERLRPFTDTCPKALCRVHGLPLIEHHLIQLSLAGFTRVVINHAHLGGKIRQHLGHGHRFNIEIVYAPEPPGGLETGGGIFNALSLLGNEPFLTLNADIITNYPYNILTSTKTKDAHIILIPKPDYFQHGDFGLTDKQYVMNAPRIYTFAGIAIYNPKCFVNKLPGRYSVTPILRQLAEKKQLTGEIYSGDWLDIGTAERLALASSLQHL